MRFSFEKRIYATFGLAVICLIIIGLLTLNFANRYLHLYKWEKASYLALMQIDELTMDILQMEKYLHDYHQDTSVMQYTKFQRSVNDFKTSYRSICNEEDDSIIREKLISYENLISASFDPLKIDSINPEYLRTGNLMMLRNRIIVEQFNVVNTLQENFNSIDEQLTTKLSQRSMLTEKSLRHLIMTLLIFVILTTGTIFMFLYQIRFDLKKRKMNEERIRKSEKRLRELNKQKDKFVSIITHDLRSPFSGLLGFTGLLRQSAGDGDYSDISLYASKIDDTAKALYDLLNKLLDWFRIESGKVPFNPEQLNIREVTDAAFNLMLSNAEKKDIRLHNSIPGATSAYGDRMMTETVIRNLLSNAIKFSTAGGNVELTAEKHEPTGFVSIRVIDMGIGMDEDALSGLFSIDRVTTKTGTANEKGAGIGLLLTKEITEMQGGSLHVKSRKGEGTTFIFTLPESKNALTS